MDRFKSSFLAAAGCVILGAIVLLSPLTASAQGGILATPFQRQLDLCFAEGEEVIPPGGIAPAGGFVDVPAGKRLAIEYVSAVGRLPSGQKLTVAINIFIAPAGTFVFGHFLPVSLIGTFNPDGDLFVGSEPTIMYAEGGSRVQFSARRSGGPSPTGTGCVTVRFSGFVR
jgi:hypothetical protein